MIEQLQAPSDKVLGFKMSGKLHDEDYKKFVPVIDAAAAPINPRLGPLANNGGRTRTHALLPGIPAIDRGDNANQPPTDQRGPGFGRRKDGNGDGRAVVDMGAFER